MWLTRPRRRWPSGQALASAVLQLAHAGPASGSWRPRKPGRDDVLLGAVGPARRRLDVGDLVEPLLEQRLQRRPRRPPPAPWRRRCRPAPARRRRTPPPPRTARRCAGGRSAGAPRRPPPCPTGPRRRGRRASRAPASSAPSSRKSRTCSSTPGIGSTCLQVDAEHPPARLAREPPVGVDPRRRDLAPAARRGAEIDHAAPGPQEAIARRRARSACRRRARGSPRPWRGGHRGR